MTTHATRDGRILTWTARGACVCAACDEIFNSVAAFDMHLRREKGAAGHGLARHDITGMPRNARGYLVTSLRDAARLPTTQEPVGPER